MISSHQHPTRLHSFLIPKHPVVARHRLRSGDSTCHASSIMSYLMVFLLLNCAFIASAAAQSGRSMATAIDLGDLSQPTERCGTVDESDYPFVYYRFEIPDGVADVNLALKSSNSGGGFGVGAELIADLNGTGTREENEVLAHAHLNQEDGAWLGAGIYYVRVVLGLFSESDPFCLKITPSYKPDSAGERDDTLALARIQSPLIPGQRKTDYAALSDPADYYRFVITNFVAEVKIELQSSPGLSSVDCNLVQDSNGNGLVDGGEVIGRVDASGTIRVWLDPGEYYVRILQPMIFFAGRNGDYSFLFTVLPKPTSMGQRDNHYSSAGSLGTLTTNFQVEDFVGASDPVDTFQFVVVNRSRQVSLAIPEGSLVNSVELLLLDAQGMELESSSAYPFANIDAQISTPLSPGVYYAQVRHKLEYELATTYQLGIGVAPLKSTPPFIVERPLGGGITSGELLNMHALADGSFPLRYQWSLNGRPVGNNSSVLVLTNEVREPGVYSVQLVVANSFGSVTNSPVEVRVGSALPSLALERVSGTLKLSWKWEVNPISGFTLEAAPTPAGPWQFQPQVLVEGNGFVVVPMNDRSLFYRLSKP